MKSQVSKYLIKLSQKIFPSEEEQNRFVAKVSEGIKSPQAIAWTKPRPNTDSFETLPPNSDQPTFIDRLVAKQRPGKNELHDKGYYYCLDYSSVMMALPLTAIHEPIHSVLDMCAAPGGKSILSHLFFHPTVLVSNEVIGKRCGALISNLKRCEIPSIVTSQDPEKLKELLPESFDLVVVDAPCSGQSLLAKGEEAPGCFHPSNVNKCMNRQRRVIANSSGTVRPGGYLLYSTCTYSPEENEDVCEWFLKKFPEFQPIQVGALAAFQTSLSEFPFYRFSPDENTGAGGFAALFQKKTTDVESSTPEIPESIIRWKFQSLT